MASCAHDPQYWKKADWIAVAFIFGLLMLYPLMNGYPLIYLDSWTYAAGMCRPSMRSPILGCAMRPIILTAGTWGYVIVQTTATVFSFVFLSKYVLGYVDNIIVTLEKPDLIIQGFLSVYILKKGSVQEPELYLQLYATLSEQLYH